MAVLLETIELATSAAGYAKYTSAQDSFITMYSNMNSDTAAAFHTQNGTATAGVCVYSCCL